MKITALEGQNIEELSMIEVAHALLEQSGEEMAFADIVTEVQSFLEKSDGAIAEALSHFYTDLNTDGSFIPLGNNTWGLRSWYAIDSIDEETISLDYFDDEGKIKDELDEDVLDVTINDDETDNGSYNTKKIEDMNYDNEDEDEDKNEAKAYDEELAEVEVDADIPEDEVGEIEEVDEDDDED